MSSSTVVLRLSESELASLRRDAALVYRSLDEFVAVCALEQARKCGFVSQGSAPAARCAPTWGAPPSETARTEVSEIHFNDKDAATLRSASGYLKFIDKTGLVPVTPEVFLRESALRMTKDLPEDPKARSASLRTLLSNAVKVTLGTEATTEKTQNPAGRDKTEMWQGGRGRSSDAGDRTQMRPSVDAHGRTPQSNVIVADMSEPEPVKKPLLSKKLKLENEDDGESLQPLVTKRPSPSGRKKRPTGDAAQTQAVPAFDWKAPENRWLLGGGAMALLLLMVGGTWAASRDPAPPTTKTAVAEDLSGMGNLELGGAAAPKAQTETPPTAIDPPPPPPPTTGKSSRPEDVQAMSHQIDGMRAKARDKGDWRLRQAKVAGDAHNIDVLLQEKYGRPTIAADTDKPKKRYAALDLLSNSVSADQKYDPFIAAAVDDVKHVFPVPPELVKGIIKRESDFNPNAQSHVGALGLMQVMPFNAERVGLKVEDLKDPELNILGGTRLIAVLLKYYQGDVISALTAYNARPRSLFAAVPRNGETPEYVDKVLGYYQGYLGRPLREMQSEASR
jgi:soluble lytic murein transglycosylase-like protein